MSKEKAKELDIDNLSLEEGFEKIEELMNEMTDSDIPLEESFEKYKLGMQLLKHCSDKIDKVEKQIQVLSAEDISEDE